MKFANISLADVAAILGVCISALGLCVSALGVWAVFFVASDIRQYRLQQRSEAAQKALLIVKDFAFYIKAIGTNQGLYEYLDYYPDRMPEISSNDNERYEERPFRLISNEINKFSKEFEAAIIKIAEKDTSSLYKMLDEIKELVRGLNDLLPQKRADKKSSDEMIVKWIKEKPLWLKKVDEICSKVECKLYPLIDGKD